ncbi:MAG: hypothetical protein JSR44_10985 [Spirochaetes bacterium]|nr:hypothetical protein [Spirochaetota bacterium]
MKKQLWGIFCVTLSASCTAINQKDAYLDNLAAKIPVTVFSENFESGLSQWSQLSGTWTTGTPAPNGVALISPTSALAATFSITTVNNIDLSQSANCELQYDARYSLSASAGVLAQVLYAGSVVGELKNTSGTSAISSATQFVTYKTTLTTGITGKLTILTAVAAGTAADVRIDNILVTCNNPLTAAYSSVLDNFENGAANWSLASGWALTAGAGVAGSTAAKVANSSPNTAATATYLPNINLQGRSGCVLSYFYNLAGSGYPTYNVTLYINALAVRADYASVPSLTVSQYLTAFEGQSANTLYIGCMQTGNPSVAICAIDNLTLNCQQ